MEEGNILDPVFQQRLEDARVLLRQEIQKELKIKEAAERMRRAITNRKSAADVDGQLKASRRKLERLHSELQEVNARAMAPEKDSNSAGWHQFVNPTGPSSNIETHHVYTCRQKHIQTNSTDARPPTQFEQPKTTVTLVALIFVFNKTILTLT